MSQEDYFISCDWGTTNFRLRVVEAESMKIVDTITTDQGVKSLYEKSPANPKQRQHLFSNYLCQQIENLPPEYRKGPVVISGMASSNIGMREIAYANMPVGYTGEDLNWESLELINGMTVILISGVKTQKGMMRGEETQAIGLAPHLAHNSGVLLLPGTHSKHLSFSNNCFTDLKTFMTGELFQVISSNSILRSSLEEGSCTDAAMKAFSKGVALGAEGKLTDSLFSIRALDVLHQENKTNNFYLLSGLLIGDELAYLINNSQKVFLAAANQILTLYQTALDLLLDPKRLVNIKATDLSSAVLVGQKKILELNERK